MVTMREFDYEETHLQKYRNAALKFTNKIREALNEPPLDALLPGAIAAAEACVVTKSIEAHGLYGSTNYRSVNIFTSPLKDEQALCELEEHREDYLRSAINEEWGQYDPMHTHIKPTKSFRVPADVQRFLKAFDDGQYPDLVARSPFIDVDDDDDDGAEVYF